MAVVMNSVLEVRIMRRCPEHEIVKAAAEWRADLLIICPRAQYGGKWPWAQNRLDMLLDLSWITLLVRCFWCAPMRETNSRFPGDSQPAFREDSYAIHFSLELVEHSTQHIRQRLQKRI
jgi:hypothetical protein